MMLITTSIWAQNAASYIYRAKSGETPEFIAFEFIENAADKAMRRKFYAHNHISNERSTQPVPEHQPFNIPVSWMYLTPATASVVSTSGNTEMSHANTNGQFVPVKTTGLIIEEGTRIKTGKNSFALLRFPDNSLLSVNPNSTVTLETLRRYATSDIFKIQVKVNTGRVESQVTPLKHPAADYSVKSKRLSTAVRGTRFSVGDDPSSDAVGEVQEGAVQLTDTANTVLSVPHGFGTHVQDTTAAAITPLLPAPEWICSAINSTNIDKPLSLSTDKKTQLLKLEIYAGLHRNLDLLNPIQQTTAPQAILPADLPNGNYTLRVRSIDANGINGFTSQQMLKVQKTTVASTMDWVLNPKTHLWLPTETPSKKFKQTFCINK